MKLVRSDRSLVLILVLAIVASGFRCDRGTRDRKVIPLPARPTSQDARSYLGLFSLSEVKDQEHPVPVIDSMGRNWFRSDTPLVTLDWFDTKHISLYQTSDGRYALQLLAKDEPSRASLWAWTSPYVGKYVGILVDGKLNAASRLSSELQGQIAIQGFQTEKEALAEAERIKQAVQEDR